MHPFRRQLKGQAAAWRCDEASSMNSPFWIYSPVRVRRSTILPARSYQMRAGRGLCTFQDAPGRRHETGNEPAVEELTPEGEGPVQVTGSPDGGGLVTDWRGTSRAARA